MAPFPSYKTQRCVIVPSFDPSWALYIYYVYILHTEIKRVKWRTDSLGQYIVDIRSDFSRSCFTNVFPHSDRVYFARGDDLVLPTLGNAEF